MSEEEPTKAGSVEIYFSEVFLERKTSRLNDPVTVTQNGKTQNIAQLLAMATITCGLAYTCACNSHHTQKGAEAYGMALVLQVFESVGQVQ